MHPQLPRVGAGDHANPQRNVVARSKLVIEPADTMDALAAVVLVTGHAGHHLVAEQRARLSDGAGAELAVTLGLIVWDVVQVDIPAPRALRALIRALQFPAGRQPKPPVAMW